MDILAHGLWTAALFKYFNKKNKFNLKLAAFWGVFPDIFAFTIPFIYILWNIIFNKFSPPSPAALEPVSKMPLSNLTHILYNISHSIIIFLLIFILSVIIFRKIFWEIFGWLLHILIDIPSHSYNFFPTPFLWPLSDWKFTQGISWISP